MYYYYPYYGTEHTKKLCLKINFESKSNESLSFTEFNIFLNSINEIHRRVIFLTQFEYQNYNRLKDIDDVKLLSYHDLEIKRLCKRNPYELWLCFDIVENGISNYWTMWRFLIDQCKEYGSDSKSMSKTYRELKKFYKITFDQFFNPEFNYLIPKFKIPYSLEKGFENLFEKFKEMKTDKKTEEFYNNFCSYSIKITDCISTVLKLDEGFEENPINLIGEAQELTEMDFNIFRNS